MTETTGQKSIMDVVSEGRYNAMNGMRAFFGARDRKVLEPWVPVINALQALPPQFIEDVGIPVVQKFFEDEDLDPTSAYGRTAAMPFIPIIATSVTDAVNAVYQNMQMQAEKDRASKPRVLGAPGSALM